MGHRPLPLPATRARRAACAETTTPGVQQEQRGCREDDCLGHAGTGRVQLRRLAGSEDRGGCVALWTLHRGYSPTEQAIQPSRSVALSASDSMSRPSRPRLLRDPRDRTAVC